jgi:hypothetical protein
MPLSGVKREDARDDDDVATVLALDAFLMAFPNLPTLQNDRDYTDDDVKRIDDAIRSSDSPLLLRVLDWQSQGFLFGFLQHHGRRPWLVELLVAGDQTAPYAEAYLMYWFVKNERAKAWNAIDWWKLAEGAYKANNMPLLRATLRNHRFEQKYIDTLYWNAFTHANVNLVRAMHDRYRLRLNVAAIERRLLVHVARGNRDWSLRWPQQELQRLGFTLR